VAAWPYSFSSPKIPAFLVFSSIPRGDYAGPSVSHCEDDDENTSTSCSAEGAEATFVENVVGTQSEGACVEEGLFGFIWFDPVI
jgi:hypothetical protein